MSDECNHAWTFYTEGMRCCRRCGTAGHVASFTANPFVMSVDPQLREMAERIVAQGPDMRTAEEIAKALTRDIVGVGREIDHA
jgi:hypothetical protein